MCQVCIIGYAISGSFLSLAYFDLYYDIIIILVCMEKILLPAKKKAPAYSFARPPSKDEGAARVNGGQAVPTLRSE